MINNISLDNLKKNDKFHYLKELRFFQEKRNITFTDGVNIIFSPNGSGKSTLLRMMALSLAAEQGGISKITRNWLMEVKKQSLFSKSNETIFNGIDIFHDGQPALYVDARKKVGLNEKMELDDDFSIQGIDEIMNKRSDGFKTINRSSKVHEYLDDFKSFPKEIECAVNNQDVPEYALEILKAKIRKGKPTIMMDEPESGLSAIFQGNFFDNIGQNKNFKKFQWIIATHSPFSLLLPNVNIINLTEEDDYLDNTLNAYKILFDRLKK